LVGGRIGVASVREVEPHSISDFPPFSQAKLTATDMKGQAAACRSRETQGNFRSFYPHGRFSVHTRRLKMRKTNALPGLIFVVILGVGLALAYLEYAVSAFGQSASIAVVAFVIAIVASYSIKIADQWERTVVLRLGRFRSLEGPGLFFIIPIIETIPYWIDTRVITRSFKAEKTLTKDTVPVDVDAVLFWKVIDPKKAALDVADYDSAISWASQTALRDVIGKTMLSDMLEGREKISEELQKIIDVRTEPWGINVISVEVKDVLIPAALEDAMSMQAQAERERQARVILGDSERQVAEKFGDAAKTYVNNPIALHLRAMNMLYEGLKQNSTIVIVPSSAVETMQLGGLAGLTALTMGLGQQHANQGKGDRQSWSEPGPAKTQLGDEATGAENNSKERSDHRVMV
jgi:regulator of protease activity HflC (stomatin/prohibitin superfamily)